MRYKGTYRLRTPIDKSTNTFPREYTGQFADNDVYIDCQKEIKIFYYGKGILQAYIPSLGRGHNIIRDIQKYVGNIIFNIEETDSEILFCFNSEHLTALATYLKPKTNGADRSPFSSKNLPKSSYTIPDEDLVVYKEIIKNTYKNQPIAIVHMTKTFLKSLASKANTMEMIKADMAIRGLKGREYIHSIGQWNNYIKYLSSYTKGDVNDTKKI